MVRNGSSIVCRLEKHVRQSLETIIGTIHFSNDAKNTNMRSLKKEQTFYANDTDNHAVDNLTGGHLPADQSGNGRVGAFQILRWYLGRDRKRPTGRVEGSTRVPTRSERQVHSSAKQEHV